MADNILKLRVFIGLVDIGSYYSGLKQGFDELGVEAVFVQLTRNKFTREVTGNPSHWLLSLVDDVRRIGADGFRSRVMSIGYSWLVMPLTKLLLLMWTVVRFDVFIFGFASSFFNFWELPLLKVLGKKIIFVFNGSDSRPPYISGNFLQKGDKCSAAECVEVARRKKKAMRTIERYADFCINHPPQAHFHERKFVNHCFIGHPCKLLVASLTDGDRSGESNIVRILHAPSNPKPKGTEKVRALVAGLQGAGHAIQYVELTNRPNHEVLQELLRCDFVIDELYSDIPLAGLGTEAAFFGKPAVVGGYAQEELSRHATLTGLPMALYVRPEEVESVVRRLLEDKPYRLAAGLVAQRFVTEQWTPSKVAARFLRLLTGNVPPEWWYDPKSIRYLYGWGGSEQQIREYLAEVIKVGGPSALHLSDKPELEASFLRFARSRENTGKDDASLEVHAGNPTSVQLGVG
jgi:hypothetical protein